MKYDELISRIEKSVLVLMGIRQYTRITLVFEF